MHWKWLFCVTEPKTVNWSIAATGRKWTKRHTEIFTRSSWKEKFLSLAVLFFSNPAQNRQLKALATKREARVFFLCFKFQGSLFSSVLKELSLGHLSFVLSACDEVRCPPATFCFRFCGLNTHTRHVLCAHVPLWYTLDKWNSALYLSW